MICISCANEHNENYCPNCGERNGIKKITFGSIIEEVFSSFTNMDRGLLNNVKSLILKPQKIVIDYINGKRKGILNPVSFLIISITIYLIIITIMKSPREVHEVANTTNSSVKGIFVEVGTFIRTYLKYFWIFNIIPLAISLKLIFKKYNFLEYVTISSFIIGQATFIGVISYLIFKIPLIFDPIVYLTILWLVYKIFKKNDNKIVSFLIAFASMFLFIILLILIIAMMGLVRYLFAM